MGTGITRGKFADFAPDPERPGQVFKKTCDPAAAQRGRIGAVENLETNSVKSRQTSVSADPEIAIL